MRSALLVLYVSGAAALSLHAAPPTARLASTRRAAGAVCVEADVDVADSSFVDPGMKGAVSWQEELETLLAPETGQEEREMMLKDLLARAPEISEEVQAALQNKDMGSLLPESSRSKQLIDDIGVVQRQVLCLLCLHGVLVVCSKCEAHGLRGRWMPSTDEEPILSLSPSVTPAGGRGHTAARRLGGAGRAGQRRARRPRARRVRGAAWPCAACTSAGAPSPSPQPSPHPRPTLLALRTLAPPWSHPGLALALPSSPCPRLAAHGPARPARDGACNPARNGACNRTQSSCNQDPARAFSLVQQEARNTVTRTPEGLETPSYRVARQGEGYEVRECEPLGLPSP